MLLLMILFFVGLYIFFAWGIVQIVKKMSLNNKTCRRLAIAFVILLPTWDLALGAIMYLPACLIIPKAVIYATAETEGIYYTGIYDYLAHKKQEKGPSGNYKLEAGAGWITEGIGKGFKYIEYLGDNAKQKYKCVKLAENNEINKYAKAICLTKDSIESKYEVRISKVKIGIMEINKKNIIDRSTGKLMAEYHEVTLMDKRNFISFIDDTRVGEGGGGDVLVSCPQNSRFDEFQYDVLKPKQ
jgi:hypothetical protein